MPFDITPSERRDSINSVVENIYGTMAFVRPYHFSFFMQEGKCIFEKDMRGKDHSHQDTKAFLVQKYGKMPPLLLNST